MVYVCVPCRWVISSVCDEEKKCYSLRSGVWEAKNYYDCLVSDRVYWFGFKICAVFLGPFSASSHHRPHSVQCTTNSRVSHTAAVAHNTKTAQNSVIPLLCSPLRSQQHGTVLLSPPKGPHFCTCTTLYRLMVGMAGYRLLISLFH